MRTQSLSCTSDSKTLDNVTVTVTTMIHFRVNPAQVYYAAYTIVEPNTVIQSLIDDVVRSELPKLTLDESYEAKASMVQEIKKVVQEGMAGYGFEIAAVLITDLRPDASVLRAMNEINAARRLREAAIDKAEAEKILAVKAGEADAETKYLSGVGVARMRSAITDGFNESINKMADKEKGMSPQEVVNMMLTTQYLDVLNSFAANGRGSIVVPHGLSMPSEMQHSVRDGMIQAAALAGGLEGGGRPR
jgi:regulator of protease activity HflC (stomatin/prohibitin superfamily)